MTRICELTGKRPLKGHRVSHANNKTKRRFIPGIKKVTFKSDLLKRNVNIDDIGNSALYLVSDLAAGVTGEIHYVDAGYNKVGMPDPKNISQ